MKKTKAKKSPVEVTGMPPGVAEPTNFSADPPPVPFGPDTIWFGGSALTRLVKHTAEQYPDDESAEEEEGSLGAGLRQVEAVLAQFQDVMGVRVRLIFGTPDKPLHELDVSDVPTSQGQLDTDDIQKWLRAGASLVADTRDLT